MDCRSIIFDLDVLWNSIYNSSPKACDEALGSMRSWPADCVVLLLGAFPLEELPTVLRRAVGHARNIGQESRGAIRDHQCLVDLTAQLCVPTRFARGSAVCPALPDWRFGRANRTVFPLHVKFASELSAWRISQGDFHWPTERHNADWEHYHRNQQDDWFV